LSAEDVELVRSFQPGPDVDLAIVLNDEEASARWIDEVAQFFHPSVRGTMRFGGMAPVTYSGMDGLRNAWRDWLRSWVSFRVEIEDVVERGDSVVMVYRGRGRRAADAPEISLRRAAVWTLRDRRVADVEFNVPYDEALATVRPAN
jgi:SnoaL-like domain